MFPTRAILIGALTLGLPKDAARAEEEKREREEYGRRGILFIEDARTRGGKNPYLLVMDLNPFRHPCMLCSLLCALAFTMRNQPGSCASQGKMRCRMLMVRLAPQPSRYSWPRPRIIVSTPRCLAQERALRVRAVKGKRVYGPLTSCLCAPSSLRLPIPSSFTLKLKPGLSLNLTWS